MEQAHRGRSVGVDAEADAGAHGNLRAVFRDDLFGFDVDTLTNFIWRRFAQSTFTGYVCGHLDWLVHEWL